MPRQPRKRELETHHNQPLTEGADEWRRDRGEVVAEPTKKQGRKVLVLRLSEHEHHTFQALGGPTWLRTYLEENRVPMDEESS